MKPDPEFAWRLEDAYVDFLFKNGTTTRENWVRKVFAQFIEITREDDPDKIQWVNISDLAAIAATTKEMEIK